MEQLLEDLKKIEIYTKNIDLYKTDITSPCDYFETKTKAQEIM